MLFKGREYYLAAILIIVISIFLFMWSFEKRKPKTREVVVLAVMTGIATLGRVMFFMLPQFKPCVAIIIITGIKLGKQSGFLCGCFNGFCVRFFLRQGPWTPCKCRLRNYRIHFCNSFSKKKVLSLQQSSTLRIWIYNDFRCVWANT